MLVLITFFYVFHFTIGFSLNIHRNPYESLFRSGVFLIHFMLAALFAFYGSYFHRVPFFCGPCYIPITFLLTFYILNQIVRITLKRNMMIVSRWQGRPEGYKWYADGLISFLVMLIPIVLPMMLAVKKGKGIF